MTQPKEPPAAIVYADLKREVSILSGKTVSTTLHQDEKVKIVLFGFAAGQELSEHTAAVPAILQFFGGNATVGLGEQTIEAGDGTMTYLPARLPHSIKANTDTKMLLTLLKG